MIPPRWLTKQAKAKGWKAHTFYAGCGYHVRSGDGRKPAEFSVWGSDVDCRGCLDPS